MDKIYFTEEELEELYPAEIHFESVLKQSQLRSAPAWLTKKIAKIYEDRYGKRLNKNYNCSVCAFSVYRIVGKAYYESKEYYAQLVTEESKLDEISEVSQTVDTHEDKPTKKSSKKNGRS